MLEAGARRPRAAARDDAIACVGIGRGRGTTTEAGIHLPSGWPAAILDVAKLPIVVEQTASGYSAVEVAA